MKNAYKLKQQQQQQQQQHSENVDRGHEREQDSVTVLVYSTV